MRNDFKIFLKQMPALRLVIGFIMGILMSEYIGLSMIFCSLAILLLLIAFFSYSFLSISKKFQYRALPGIFIFLILTSTGSIAHYYNNITHREDWYGQYREVQAYKAIIISAPEEKEKSFKTIVEIPALYIQNKWTPATGKMLLYFRKDSTQPPRIGTQIVFKKSPQLIKNAGNPGEFDYQTYIRRKNIYHQLFLNKTEFEVLSKRKAEPLRSFLHALRHKLTDIIEQNIQGHQERAVAKALLIGYRKDIGNELYTAFTNTGIVHIIAISGMHLGMIYALLFLLVKPITKKKHGKVISNLLILIVIWLFTLIAGAVPSITRAAVMFSFLVTGNMLQRKTNIYNSLAASAFVLLMFDTFTLWDVGFLLSYAAVLSIIIFQKRIANLLYLQNKLLKVLWNMSAVTISAQIITLPLILYYFQQFPNLFLIANFIAIPLSTLILYGEVALIVCAGIPLLARFIGTVIEYLIWLFNQYILHINEIPFTVSRIFPVGIWQTVALFVLITALYNYFLRRNKYWLYASLLSFAFFFSAYLNKRLQNTGQSKIIVYNSPQNLIIDFISGAKVQTISKFAIPSGTATQTYILQPAHYTFMVHPTRTLEEVKAEYPYLQYKKYRIFVLSQNSAMQIRFDTSIRLVIIDNYPEVNLPRIQENFPRATVLFANTNNLWKTEQWKKQCKALHLRCHFPASQGAYIVKE